MRPDYRSDTPVAQPPATPQPNAVSLQIERVVIDGMPLTASQGVQLQRALQRELTRLIQGGGVAGVLNGVAVPTLMAPSIEIGTSLRPADLGKQIARSVYDSLAQSP